MVRMTALSWVGLQYAGVGEHNPLIFFRQLDDESIQTYIAVWLN